MEKYNELLKLVKSLEEDFKKFYGKDNNAAGTRLRKSMQEVKQLAQSVRVEVSEIKLKNK